MPAIAAVGSSLLLRRHAGRTGGPAHSGRAALAAAGVVPDEARITVSRTSTDDVGFREIFVSLNGDELGILRHGESLTTGVPSGPHRIRAHNTLFWKTHQLILAPGEHARFTAINRAGWGTFGMLFIIGAMPVYLTFDRLPDKARGSDARPPAG